MQEISMNEHGCKKSIDLREEFGREIYWSETKFLDDKGEYESDDKNDEICDK